jgi:hypothetical protein
LVSMIPLCHRILRWLNDLIDNFEALKLLIKLCYSFLEYRISLLAQW